MPCRTVTIDVTELDQRESTQKRHQIKRKGGSSENQQRSQRKRANKETRKDLFISFR